MIRAAAVEDCGRDPPGHSSSVGPRRRTGRPLDPLKQDPALRATRRDRRRRPGLGHASIPTGSLLLMTAVCVYAQRTSSSPSRRDDRGAVPSAAGRAPANLHLSLATLPRHPPSGRRHRPQARITGSRISRHPVVGHPAEPARRLSNRPTARFDDVADAKDGESDAAPGNDGISARVLTCDHFVDHDRPRRRHRVVFASVRSNAIAQRHDHATRGCRTVARRRRVDHAGA